MCVNREASALRLLSLILEIRENYFELGEEVRLKLCAPESMRLLPLMGRAISGVPQLDQAIVEFAVASGIKEHPFALRDEELVAKARRAKQEMNEDPAFEAKLRKDFAAIAPAELLALILGLAGPDADSR